MIITFKIGEGSRGNSTCLETLQRDFTREWLRGRARFKEDTVSANGCPAYACGKSVPHLRTMSGFYESMWGL